MTIYDFSSNSFVIGVGASAGGLKALEVFFTNLPVNPQAAFVVVQHLSPDFRSLMVELLQKRTQLPVYVIEDGMTLELNSIYVLPPRFSVTLKEQQLLLKQRQGGVADYLIDHFFLSLAREKCDRTMGILLSGTGSDGTEGLKAISQAGGIALVQSQETAQFGAMPGNPISSGLVDEILGPEELARAVHDILRYTNAQLNRSPLAEPLLPLDKLDQILDLLKQQENIDFSQYKPGTLHRRITHRLLLSKIKTVEDYITHLSLTPTEIKNLCQDLLIGATRFFRDPNMWSILQTEILPKILDQLQPGQTLRIWVSACSTGEEVYSLAIAIDEVIKQLEHDHSVKIFATDIDKEALVIASQGIYSNTIVQDIGLERLDYYFTREGSTYRIKKSIRSQIIFASHDLTQNPGFSQMHLVSCRNLLIYMQPNLQEQVLKLLHFSLAPQGVLLLGPSESLGSLSHAFQVLDSHWKIFRKRQGVQIPLNRKVQTPTLQPIAAHKQDKVFASPYESILASILKLRFGEHPTTCLLVGPDNQIMHIFINTARLLEFPLGKVNTSILDIVLPTLKIPVSTALHRAKREQKPVLYSNIQLRSQDPSQRLNLWVGSAKIDETTSPQQLIVLLEQVVTLDSPEIPTEPRNFDHNSDLSQQIRELEFELQETRENLQTSIEELETANEEQQATNEELLAANEELQSTNEELQSVNEELYTVNGENQERIGELIELNTDIDNLLQSTDIGVVFLDQDLNIRKFTPAATQVFKFRPGDIGRPLSELVHHLDIEHLIPLAQQVSETHVTQTAEAVNLKTGTHLLLRILPYLREDESIDGIVITLITINDLRQTQAQLKASGILNQQLEEQLQHLTQRLEQSQKVANLGDWSYDFHDHRLIWATEVFEITEFPPDAGVPSIQTLSGIVHADDQLRFAKLIDQPQKLETISSSSPINLDIKIHPPNNPLTKYINIRACPMRDSAGQLNKLYGTVMDITDSKNVQNDLKKQAFFDVLTKLPNRAFFLEHLKLSIARVGRDTVHQFTVFYLDIDDFKEINDTLGHAAGDHLLTEVARRLEDASRPGDIVSRIGGDEFAILLEKTSRMDIAMEIANRIQSGVSEPLTLASSSRISVTSSIGIAFYKDNDHSWPSETAVLENADIAMYQAKRKGPGNVELFQPAMRTERTDHIELKTGLNQALEQDEFVLHYQPLMHLPRQALIGFEALIRWQHPQRGLLAPMEFLPIVQDSHLMPQLESWIFKQACRQLHQWHQKFSLLENFHLNINISSTFITSTNFLSELKTSLKESQVNPNQICIELTEHSFIGRGSKVKTLLQNLKELGIQIALDDFGTGYSSLSYLHRLPIDILKIDQSFIQSLSRESSLMRITRGIASLARQLELNITAEGIETAEQLRLVNTLGCDYGQGYVFSHPIPAEEAGQLIANPQPIKCKI